MDHSSEAHTTARILGRIRAGDAVARDDLVARIQPYLRRFAKGRVPASLRAQADTADLVQQTWLKALESLDRIEASAPGAFFAYLRTILINALRESLRRSARAPLVHDAEHLMLIAPTLQVEPEDWLLWEQALSRLEPERRGLVSMRLEFGMSYAEMAQELGESVDGVRMKVNRALAKMADAHH